MLNPNKMNFRLLFRLFFLSILYLAVQGSQVSVMKPKISSEIFQPLSSDENQIFVLENPSQSAQWEAIQHPGNVENSWIHSIHLPLPHLLKEVGRLKSPAKRGPANALFMSYDFSDKNPLPGEEIVRNFVSPAKQTGVKVFDALRYHGK